VKIPSTTPLFRSLKGRAPAARTAIGRVGSFPYRSPTWPGTVSRPAPERNLGVDYDTEWSRKYPARLFRAVVLDNVTRPVAHLTTSPQVRGEELLELLDPPAIFVANHESHLDTPLLLSLLPARFRHKTVVAAAADHFFDRRWKSHVWSLLLAAIPIERHRVNRKSSDQAADLIEGGWNLVIFAEGGRSPDGWQQPFRPGAAYLATRTGRPVVPVHLHGTWRVLPKGSGRVRRSPCTLTFGSPITARPDEDTRRFNHRIEAAVSALAAESRTDWWTARRTPAESAIREAQGPDASDWRRSWSLGPSPGQGETADPRRWGMRRIQES